MLPARSTTAIFKIVHSELLNFLPLIKIQAELADLLSSYKKLIFSHYMCNQWRLPGRQGSLPGCLQSCAAQPWTKLWPKTLAQGADPKEHLLLQHKTLLLSHKACSCLSLPLLVYRKLSKDPFFYCFPLFPWHRKGLRYPGTQGTHVENCHWLFQTCDLTKIFTSTGEFSQHEATSLSGNILVQISFVLARRIWPERLPWQCFLTALLTKITR